MEILADLAKILLPAALVLYGMYTLAKTFLEKEFDRKLAEMRVDNNKTILPLKLQAYERMCLFLERISPHNLVVRVNDPAYDVAQLRNKLLMEVRNEYNHNLSQQLYMSDASWSRITNAKEEIISLINKAAGEVKADARSVELAKLIFEKEMSMKTNPTVDALRFVKAEARRNGI